MSAPKLIGALSFPLNQSVLPTCRVGPFNHGSDKWIVAAENPDSVTGPNLAAFKSTDGGVTYVRIVGGPQVTQQFVLSFDPGFAYVYYRGSGTVIDVGYQGTDFTLNAIAFDMASETFGTPSFSGVTAPIGVTGVGLTNIALLVQPSGARSIVYSQYNIPLFVVTESGSPMAWGSPVEVDDGSQPNYYFENAVIDGDGNIGIVFEHGSSPGFRFGNNIYARYNGTTILSRATMPFVASMNTGVWCAPSYDSTSNSVYFPLTRTVVVGIDNLPATSIYVGHVPSAPTWTAVTIKLYSLIDSVPGDNIEFTNVVGNAAGTHFSAFWYLQPNFGRHYTIQQSSAPSLSGPWSAPSLFYDQNTTPPSPPAFLVGLAPVLVAILPDDSISVLVGLVETSPAFFRGVLYVFGPNAPPPVLTAQLTAVQVITGATLSPTTVTAAGPTPKSGTGGFTIQTVGVGTYILTQVAVPGCTAGPWVLTGTGGHLSGNVLTLANGDNVTVTITNTFVEGPLTVGCLVGSAELGVPFSGSIPVSGGTPPYTFSIIDGMLPPGLSLDPTTGQVSGVPTESGTFDYEDQVQDSA